MKYTFEEKVVKKVEATITMNQSQLCFLEALLGVLNDRLQEVTTEEFLGKIQEYLSVNKVPYEYVRRLYSEDVEDFLDHIYNQIPSLDAECPDFDEKELLK